ncbi:hypothetical protein B0H14DRAFT_2634336 [Mycena olivaceomarginata]|nr:hypothetical protein B0H14DRAFT_2634336 [Mycena olivaceomarginata]
MEIQLHGATAHPRPAPSEEVVRELSMGRYYAACRPRVHSSCGQLRPAERTYAAFKMKRHCERSSSMDGVKSGVRADEDERSFRFISNPENRGSELPGPGFRVPAGARFWYAVGNNWSQALARVESPRARGTEPDPLESGPKRSGPGFQAQLDPKTQRRPNLQTYFLASRCHSPGSGFIVGQDCDPGLLKHSKLKFSQSQSTAFESIKVCVSRVGGLNFVNPVEVLMYSCADRYLSTSESRTGSSRQLLWLSTVPISVRRKRGNCAG